MKAVVSEIMQNKLFYTLNLVLIVFVLFFLILFTRAEGFIWLNQFHTKSLNLVFEAITFLGDGLFIIVTALVLFFFKKTRNLAFIIILSYLSSGLFAQLIKNMIIAPRPSVYFRMYHHQYYLDTFAHSRIGFKSFPSGHTASFFALATVLSGYFKKRYICWCLLILSMMVGYSRVYLAHHFLIDVCVGAIIGLVFGVLSLVWYKTILATPQVINKLRTRKFFEALEPNHSLN
ncbi:phosphatase PAP2 family protein [Flavobacterium sp. UMI-01]|uniref:phosphatase PAP2 family protein n=1 Tax=Flavobacterium sp. UMI-01 TaxID=1441053 RepID=UPI001C7CE682|nr:phosphatase PAP2 family protein [Flavobacterium sp. UMI-01]GIZ10409.1 hypothetical protein FUMI01_31330 [Flavobacterium sp. UMI-01]